MDVLLLLLVLRRRISPVSAALIIILTMSFATLYEDLVILVYSFVALFWLSSSFDTEFCLYMA